jgi:hypothetical protein
MYLANDVIVFPNYLIAVVTPLRPSMVGIKFCVNLAGYGGRLGPYVTVPILRMSLLRTLT